MSTVIGYFDDWERADRAVRDLIADGASRDAVSVIASDKGRGERRDVGGVQTTDPHGAAAGATTGAVLGGAVGVAIGLGALVIPGIGPILAAGPLASALAGGAAGAAAGGVAGGLLGALMDAGVPKERAEHYVEGVKRGGVLVTLQAPSDAASARAERILTSAGAVDVLERGEEWRRSGWGGGDRL